MQNVVSISKTKKKKRKVKVLFIIVSVIFFIYSITLIFPFLFLVNNSFKTNGEMLLNPWKLPNKLQFANYIFVFEQYNLAGMFSNTIVITLLGTFISIASVTITSYVLARYAFIGKGLIITLAITFMLIPNTGTLSATYKLINNLALMDTILGVMLLYAGPFGMNFLLLLGFFKGISNTYAEAAKIDGAGNFTIFLRIMLPMAKGGLLAVGLLTGLNLWNDYFTPFMYMPRIMTLATGLQDLSVNASNTGAYTEMFAAMTVSVVPLIVVFSVFQKTIIENTVAGGLKG